MKYGGPAASNALERGVATAPIVCFLCPFRDKTATGRSARERVHSHLHAQPVLAGFVKLVFHAPHLTHTDTHTLRRPRTRYIVILHRARRLNGVWFRVLKPISTGRVTIKTPPGERERDKNLSRLEEETGALVTAL